ncbi:winged helix DNA-binding domain-containing protein [Actinoplanes sp. NPDC049599]|uniref:winged helix DNA-binding domain-containing protein n=1 Tax=Actinoplanes sp. NPDC049599 TaxID=3363903 RepID=UPI003797071D
MRISARALNRSTLARQLLLARERLPVPEAVRRVVALQAQHAASPYVALTNRIEDFDPVALDEAFTGRAVLKATLMRVTLHAVHAGDFAAFRTAVQPSVRAARLHPRFVANVLPAADADTVVPELLLFAGQPRTGVEMDGWLRDRLGALPEPGAWPALRAYAPLLHAPTGAPWMFGTRPSYVASGLPAVGVDPAAAAAALRTLALRYLAGFGPASVADLAQFAFVPRSRARAALAGLADGLAQFEGPDGAVLYDVPGGPLPAEDVPAPPRLMAMWDSILLAYADRSRVLPPEYRRLVIQANGDVLPTLLVDGHVAGVWRPVEDGIEARAFHRLPEEAWAGLAAEARTMTALVAAREPRVYRRYDRWWRPLPAAESRVLPG